MSGNKIAVIDIGSNSVRLVVYNVSKGYSIKELQDVKMPIRLFQYLDDEKNLSEKGVNLLVETLQVFRAILNDVQVSEIIATATAVMRQAKNREKVFETVKELTEFEIRLLSEKEEASYGQYAVCYLTSFKEAYTVDMGGGSTEITYFKDNELKHYKSFPFGAVTLKEMFFENKKHGDRKAMEAAGRYVKEQLTTEKWIRPRGIPVVAMGGSSRNMASVFQRKVDYPMAGLDGFDMSEEEISETKDYLASKSLSQLLDLDGLSKERADIIIPAVVAFEKIIKVTKAERFYFVNEGLREGLLLTKINAKSPETHPELGIEHHMVKYLLENYGVSEKEARIRYQRMKIILDLLKEKNLDQFTSQLNDYLFYASNLYMIGSYIGSDELSMHTFYLLANSNMVGFNHKGKIIIALLASFKNKGLFNQYIKPYQSWFTDKELDMILYGGNLLRFCDALNVTFVNQIQKAELLETKEGFKLSIKWTINPVAESFRADRQKKRLENILGKKVELDFYN